MTESYESARVKFLNLFLPSDWTSNEVEIDRQSSSKLNDGHKFVI